MDRIPGASKFRITKAPLQNPSQTFRRHHGPKEKRAATACDFCHRRKKRCDLLFPSCSGCVRAKVQCTISERERRAVPPKYELEPLKDRVEWLEQLVLKATGVDVAGLSTGDFFESQAQWHAIPSLVAGLPHNRQAADDAVEGVESRDEESASGLLDVGAVLSDKLENRRAVAVPAGPCEVVWVSSFTEASDIATNYFESVGYQYPFLDRSRFTEDMRQLYDGEPASRESHFFYHITMAVSLLIKPADGKSSEAFYQSCYASLPSILHAEDVVALRALLSLALYALFCTSGPSIWHILGMAMRVATALGLHKAQQTAETPSLEELTRHEMEKRAFWSLYALDRLIAVTLGRPLGIADEDVVVSLPGEYNDDWELAPGECSMSIPIHVIKLRKIFSQIYITLYRTPSSPPSPNRTSQILAAFRASLDTWRTSAPLLPSALHYSTAYFDYLYYTTLILLYRPSPHNPTPSSAAIVACGDSAIQVIRNYYDSYVLGEIKWIWLTLAQLYAAGLTLLWCVQQNARRRTAGYARSDTSQPWRVEEGTVRYGVEAVGVLLDEFRRRRKEVGRLATFFESQKEAVMGAMTDREGSDHAFGQDEEESQEQIAHDREAAQMNAAEPEVLPGVWEELVDWFGGDLGDVYALTTAWF